MNLLASTLLLGLVMFVGASATASAQWNRSVKSEVTISPTSTPNQYSTNVAMGYVNGTTNTLDFSADLTILVNGNPAGAVAFIVSGGQSAFGCSPCPSSTCAGGGHSLSSCASTGSACQCDAVIRGGALLAGVNIGDLIRVELAPRPGAVLELDVSDDFVEFVFSGAAGAFCFGDGTATPCPCGNNSPMWLNAGCLNSMGVAAVLTASGTSSLSSDTFALVGADMPNSSALYFQGTAQQSGGLGAAFGDGLRCVAGSVVRLGTKTNVSGTSAYPSMGDAPVSIQGIVVAPGSRNYQVWYRNAAAFCTSSTFNLTNGFHTVWSP